MSLGPALDTAGQGDAVEKARSNLKEALTLFLHEAYPTEVEERLRGAVFATSVEVALGQTPATVRKRVLRDPATERLHRGAGASPHIASRETTF